IAGIEKIIADLDDVLAHCLGNVAGVDLQRTSEMKPDLQFAVRRLSDLLGKQFCAARCRKIRRRLVHIEVPLLRRGGCAVPCEKGNRCGDNRRTPDNKKRSGHAIPPSYVGAASLCAGYFYALYTNAD